MTTSNLFRPPPPPPRPSAKKDPLFALSKPSVVAPEPEPRTTAAAPPERIAPEELTDLSDDDMEFWAVGGTRIIPKPTSASTPPPPAEIAPPSAAPPSAALAPLAEIVPPYMPPPSIMEPIPAALAETMKSTEVDAAAPAPMRTQYQAPSYPPIAMASVPPPPVVVKKSNTGLWLLAAAMTGVFGLAVIAAGVGLFVYRAHAAAAELAPAVASTSEDTASNVQAQGTAPAATTAAPAATTAAPVATAAPTNAPTTHTTTTTNAAGSRTQAQGQPAAAATTPPPAAHAPAAVGGLGFAADDDANPAPSTAPKSSNTGGGTIRTFAAGSGKAVFVDGHLAGIGPGPLKTACGRHSIKVGEGKARSYDVACNGSTVTVGSADGS